MKKKSVQKKKRKQVRTRNWEEAHETAFTHDRARHRRAQTAISDVAVESNSLSEDFVCNALVISHSKKWAFVLKDGQEELCLIDERLKEANATLLAPGDSVFVEREADEEPPELKDYEALGFQVIRTSCETGEGLKTLRQALAGKLSILSGHSGVGKSTLLNVLDEDLEVHTQEVSDVSQRGRHTTTASRLYELDGGIRIIDTPGIRALGVWGVSPEEVAWFFPDLAELGENCHFRNCSHTHEPDCAVTEALDAGELTAWRYDSYLRIRGSMEEEQEGPFGDKYGRKSSDY